MSFQEVVKDFERNLQDMVSMFVESIMAFMSQARDLENTHHEKLSEIALPTVDKLAKNELDDEISEDVRMVGLPTGSGGKGYGSQRHFQHYFSYIVAVSFIGGGNRSAWRKPLTCCKSLTNLVDL